MDPAIDTRALTARGGHAVLAVIGTLGAGKTTFINATLDHVRSAFDRLVIIENDVGKENVDAWALNAGADEVKALTAGCLCCADVEALKIELAKISSRPVCMGRIGVLLEPTGLADPDAIAGVLRDSGLPHKIITLLDVAGFRFNYSLGRLTQHAEVADLVICTHWDALGTEERDKLMVAEVVSYLTPRLKPGTEILFLTREGLRAQPNLLNLSELRLPEANTAPKVSKGMVHGLFPKTVSFKSCPTIDQLNELLAVACGFGTPIVRLKGFLDGRLVQYSGHGAIDVGGHSSNAPKASFVNLFTAGGALPKDALVRVLGDCLQEVECVPGPMDEAEVLTAKLLRLRAATQRFGHPLATNAFNEKSLVVDYEADDAIGYAFQKDCPVADVAAYFSASLEARLTAHDCIVTGMLSGHPDLPYYKTRVGNHLKWLIDDALSLIPEAGLLRERCREVRPASMYFEGLSTTISPTHVQVLKDPGVRWMVTMTKRLVNELQNADRAKQAALLAYDTCSNIEPAGTWAKQRRRFEQDIAQL
jgi:G3E family GTPase